MYYEGPREFNVGVIKFFKRRRLLEYFIKAIDNRAVMWEVIQPENCFE